MDNDDEKLFRSIGLKENTVKNIANNKSTANALKECINEAEITNGCNASIGKLLFDIATSKKMNENAKTHRKKLLEYVVNNKIKTKPQLNAAFNYVSKTKTFNNKEFEEMCGVGVIVSEKEIISTVDNVIIKFKQQISSKGKACFGMVIKEAKRELPWADGKLMSIRFSEKFTAAISEWYIKKKKDKKEDKKEEKEEEEEVETMDKWLTGRELPVMKNTESQLAQKHDALRLLSLDSNVFLSRFPPEPNGFLHIGHCKAMTFNFTLADKQGGKCYLRFDDTNPTTEKQIFIDNIIENCLWMGFEPWKITYSSDYFEELYSLAIKMISNGNAYVCHQTGEEIEAERKTFRLRQPKPSPYRNRSISENLKLFELMRQGYFAEGEAVLRMKGDYNSPNPNMWDHIAYRIIYSSHPKSGNKWCMYPTYDYTHCIVDSLEWITASCCTLEFENRRESYFWLLDVLDLYKPIVWEYSRLNLTYNVLSKRKLLQLVNKGYVRGWDDCRMLTINGLRRRGYTNTILRDFCNRVGVTRKDNYISPLLLQACARNELNKTCSRAMVVIKPLKIIITNYPKNKIEYIECPDFPMNKNTEKHKVKFSKIIYIDIDDFKLNQINNKKYFGLTVGKTVRLKYAYNIKCNKVIYQKNNNNKIDYLECEYDPDHKQNVKRGHLTWVDASSPIHAQFRLYDNLFIVEKPSGKQWLQQLNPQSEIIYNGFIDKYILDTFNHKQRYQFERLGYFVKDKDSDQFGYPIFNRTVTLNQTSKKKLKQLNKNK